MLLTILGEIYRMSVEWISVVMGDRDINYVWIALNYVCDDRSSDVLLSTDIISG